MSKKQNNSDRKSKINGARMDPNFSETKSVIKKERTLNGKTEIINLRVY